MRGLISALLFILFTASAMAADSLEDARRDLQNLIDRQGPAAEAVADARRRLAFIAWEHRDTVECSRQQQAIIQLMTARYGPADPRTLSERLTLADFLQATGQVDEALKVCRGLLNGPVEIRQGARERIQNWQSATSKDPLDFFVTERSFRYHIAGCRVISSENYSGSLRRIFLLDARLGGFIPCPVCRPEK